MAEGGDALDEDDALAVRAARGDAPAFDALVRRHQRAMLRTALRTLGDAMAARDAVQCALVELHRSLPRYQPRGRFRGYAYCILNHQCGMAVRKRRSTERIEGAQPEPEGAAPPDVEIARRELRARVHTAVLELSEKLRAVVVLRFTADLSLEEIAAALEIPLGTVKSRLHEALCVQLSRKLEGDDV